jgi:hypothetical protein
VQKSETSVHSTTNQFPAHRQVLQLQVQQEQFPSRAHTSDHQTTFTDCIKTPTQRTKRRKLTTAIRLSSCEEIPEFIFVIVANPFIALKGLFFVRKEKKKQEKGFK